jgi:hypothetical protein
MAFGRPISLSDTRLRLVRAANTRAIELEALLRYTGTLPPAGGSFCHRLLRGMTSFGQELSEL